MIDRRSFILGMVTAFAECVAGEAKKAAFSPPFYPGDLETILIEVERIAGEQEVKLYYEENLDLPEDSRVNWFVIYKYPEVLEEYIEIREQGYNPALEFDKFRELLSYGTVWGQNAKLVKPEMRKKEQMMGTVARILFKPGEWPPVREELA